MLDRLAAIAADSGRVADLAAVTPPDSRVPSCPDWSFRELVVHLGLVQRFWALNVQAGDPAQAWEGRLDGPEPEADLAAWVRASTDLLLGALADAGDDRPCWAWWDAPRTSGAVARHQVQEAAVHRWDAESAGRGPGPIDAAVAHDGVAEFLQMMVDPAAGGRAGGIVLSATDTGGTWPIDGHGSDQGAGDGGAEVRATASDLVLLLYRRIPTSAVEILGDAGAVDAFLAALDTE